MSSLVPYIILFAQRGGEAIVALSGVSIGGAVVGTVVMTSFLAGMAISDLVDRQNVIDSIEDAVRRAEGPPPTFAELKQMMETEQGQVELMLHQMKRSPSTHRVVNSSKEPKEGRCSCLIIACIDRNGSVVRA